MKNTDFDFDIFEAEKHRPQPNKEDNESSLNNYSNDDIISSKEGNSNKRSRSKKKPIIIASISIVVLIILAAIIVLAYPLLSSKHNPDKYIETYIECLSEKDWDKAYDFMPATDSPYITKENFKKFIEANSVDTLLSGASTMSFVIEQERTEDNKIYYSIDYIDSEGNWKTAHARIKMVKDGFWKYDEYRVIPSRKLICNADVYVPAGAKLFVDSIEVQNPESTTMTDSKTGNEIPVSVFTTDYMFSGEHEIKVLCDGFNDYIKKEKINTDNYIFYIPLTMSQDQYGKLYSRAQDDIKAVYNYACGGESGIDSSELSVAFAKDSVNSLYDEIKKSVYADNQYIDISEFAISEAKLKSQFGDIAVTCSSSAECYINFEFDYTYKITNNFDSTSEQRSDTGYASVKYIYENSKWVIDDIAVRAIF